MVRRSTADSEELAYYVCFGPEQANREELVWVAGTRWAIEESFQEAKSQGILGQYQLRRWKGWYRHIPLVKLAQALLVVARCQAAALKDTGITVEKGG